MKRTLFEINYYRHGEDVWIVKAGDKTIYTKHVIITVPSQTCIKDGKAFLKCEGKAVLWKTEAVVIS